MCTSSAGHSAYGSEVLLELVVSQCFDEHPLTVCHGITRKPLRGSSEAAEYVFAELRKITLVTTRNKF
jgi:hypothetical protein